MRSTFSVVIPTRNRADLVVPLVESIIGMPDAPDEVIVTDDASTDATVVRLGALERPPVIVRGAGTGPSAARNAAVERASSEWLVFLDDDDRPGPDWMRHFRQLAEQHPQASYLTVNYVDDAGAVIIPTDRGAPFHHVTANFLAGTFAVRATLFREVGGFDERLRFGEFTDLAMNVFDRLCAEGSTVAYGDHADLRIVGRPAAERSSLQADVFLESGRIVIDKNRQLWERDPDAFAGQLAVLGVAAMRAGRHGEARECFGAAARMQPKSLSHRARQVVAWVPGLGRLIW